MPTFLDQHPVAHASLTNEAMELMRARIKSRVADDFGVVWLNTFVAVNGQGFCLCEAPSPQAVVESHEILGYLIDVEDVLEVTPLVD